MPKVPLKLAWRDTSRGETAYTGGGTFVNVLPVPEGYNWRLTGWVAVLDLLSGEVPTFIDGEGRSAYGTTPPPSRWVHASCGAAKAAAAKYLAKKRESVGEWLRENPKKFPDPAWFKRAVRLGAKPEESGEHGFHTVRKGLKYLTDCDEPAGKLSRHVGYSGELKDTGSVPTAQAFAWLFGVKKRSSTKANPKIRVLRATLAERIKLAKTQIRADVKAGRVPATVSSFSELHDHVDANGYGGWFDNVENKETSLKWKFLGPRDASTMDAVADAVDAWIRSGALKGKVTRQNPKPFKIGARVQDVYGNVGTVESVPTSRGGSYAVRMDPDRRGLAATALLLRSEIKSTSKKKNPLKPSVLAHYGQSRVGRLHEVAELRKAGKTKEAYALLASMRRNPAKPAFRHGDHVQAPDGTVGVVQSFDVHDAFGDWYLVQELDGYVGSWPSKNMKKLPMSKGAKNLGAMSRMLLASKKNPAASHRIDTDATHDRRTGKRAEAQKALARIAKANEHGYYLDHRGWYRQNKLWHMNEKMGGNGGRERCAATESSALNAFVAGKGRLP